MGMKLVAKSEPRITADPRGLDRDNWQNVRIAVDHEAAHRDWRCALYRLHRIGRINNDQREAGDKYLKLIMDFRDLWKDRMGSIEVYRPKYDHYEKRSPQTKDVETALAHVVADGLAEESEFEIKRAQRIGKRYKEAATIAGPAKRILEDLLIEDVWPVGELGHREIGYALTRLSHFFTTGTKRKRR
jgi:hypothetical protein